MVARALDADEAQLLADFDIDEEDGNNVADAVAGDVHPDEMELYEEDDEDDARSEVNEDTQRLRDMIGKDDDIDDDVSEDDQGGVGHGTLDAIAHASNAGISARSKHTPLIYPPTMLSLLSNLSPNLYVGLISTLKLPPGMQTKGWKSRHFPHRNGLSG